ncbi:MAG: VWA domain-containing protein [Thermotogaceae bacterium]|nr:VWA domain-containing protein [Thermotogaceae bacterium]
MKRRFAFFLVSLLVVSLAFSCIRVTGVNVGSYPQVYIYATMDVPDPENANFYVIEGDEKFSAALSRVKATMKEPSVDFIVVFDITGSMDDEIRSVKAKIKDFADKVKNAGFDYRLSLVTFKDRVVRGDYGFTSDVELFKNWLSLLTASGGGDDPEAALDALMYAMRLPVRRESMKVLILVTDAPYHYKEDGSGFSKYSVDDVRYMVQKFGFILYSISPKSSEYRKLVSGFGEVFDIHSSRGISLILDEIAREVTSQIAVVYTTKERDTGQKVDFKLEADYNGKKGSGVYAAFGSYVVPSRPKVENLTIIAEGQAFVDPNKPEAQAILMAREAAILDAKRLILESLDKVKVDEEITIEDAMMTNEDLKTQVNGVIAGGEVVSEDYDEEWGVYTVEVKVDLQRIYDNILHTTKYVPKWDKRIVIGRGVVAINDKVKPAGRAVLLARRGAIAEAQANLLAVIKGMHIDADTTVEDEMRVNVNLTAKLEGVLRGAIVIDEMKNHTSLEEIMKKGYYWVSMAAPVDSRGFQYLLEKYGQKVSGGETILSAVEGTSSKPEFKPSIVAKKVKWLIIDASGNEIMLTLHGYTLCSKDGKVVFTPSVEESDELPMDMLVSLSEALSEHPNAVVYKAIKVDIIDAKVYVDADYETLRKLIYDQGIGEKGNITIVSDRLKMGSGGE